MSDRPTPETDAAQFGTGRVSVDFARRLERQRDELLEALEVLILTDGCYCLDRNEQIARGVCGYCMAKEAIANVKGGKA